MYSIARNIENVRIEIEKKKGLEPYYSTSDKSESIITDYDIFPYTRFFNGVYDFCNPIVAEREAGFRIKKNTRLEYLQPVKDTQPNICFQSSCSTVRPCHPKPERSHLHTVYDNSCIVQYR
jgi:hypothetical protein